jgi:predicted kinase
MTASVHMVFGPQGAGKTTFAQRLADEERAVRFSIDEWMEALYGQDLPRPIDLPWVMERVARCERRIWQVGAEVTRRGGSVVLDLGFMRVEDRTRFAALARAEGAEVKLHFVTAPTSIRRERVLARNREKSASFSFEVTPAMFAFMEARFEAPSDHESAVSRVVRS